MDILTWTQQMKVLQHKIEATKKEKAKIDASKLAYIEKEVIAYG